LIPKFASEGFARVGELRNRLVAREAFGLLLTVRRLADVKDAGGDEMVGLVLGQFSSACAGLGGPNERRDPAALTSRWIDLGIVNALRNLLGPRLSDGAITTSDPVQRSGRGMVRGTTFRRLSDAQQGKAAPRR